MDRLIGHFGDWPARATLNVSSLFEENDDLAIPIARVRLLLDAHPAVAFVGSLIVSGSNGVRKCEKRGGIAPRRYQTLQVETVLMVEHGFNRPRET
jgi:hypothetical protein